MRQAGVLAAAALHALRNNFERLREDHRRAALFSEGAARIPGVRTSTPDTNIVMVDMDPSLGSVDMFAQALRSRGVLLSRFGPRRLRAVTHLDISDSDVAVALQALRAAAEAASQP